ncbi:MAG: hypothetical protein AAFX85_14000 [Pseudomonadota bacterium]
MATNTPPGDGSSRRDARAHQGRAVATVAALLVLIGATVYSAFWVWGVLFAYWTLLGVRYGETFLLVPIRRADHPMLFWAITAMWGAFALWYLTDALT